MFLGFLNGHIDRPARLIGDLRAWQRGWWRSMVDDPLWTASWLADVAKKWTSVQATLWKSDNPRARGMLL